MNVTIKNSAISVVCKAHFFETNMNVFKNLLKKNSIVNIKNMKSSWKINQFINHINNIKHKTLVYVREEFIKFSQ